MVQINIKNLIRFTLVIIPFTFIVPTLLVSPLENFGFVVLVSFILLVSFHLLKAEFSNVLQKRFSQIILIGLITLILFIPQSRIFYTSSNGTSFTYWKTHGYAYVIPYKYYGLFQPLFSDHIKMYDRKDTADASFILYVNLIDTKKIALTPRFVDDEPNKFFTISNENNSFIVHTKEYIKSYKKSAKSEYIIALFYKYNTKYEIDNYFTIYKVDSKGEEIPLYRQDYLSFYNYFLNLPILLFYFLFTTTILYTIMYLRKYDLRSYSKNLYKAILMDSVEFFIMNLIAWHIILIFLRSLPMAIILIFNPIFFLIEAIVSWKEFAI